MFGGVALSLQRIPFISRHRKLFISGPAVIAFMAGQDSDALLRPGINLVMRVDVLNGGSIIRRLLASMLIIVPFLDEHPAVETMRIFPHEAGTPLAPVTCAARHGSSL
jgi:hypothetical protein